MDRFLRPTGPLGTDGHYDSYDVYANGKLAGRVERNTRRNISGIVKGFRYTAANGDTHLFAIDDPTQAAKDMLDVQARGGADAVRIAYERAHGWSTD